MAEINSTTGHEGEVIDVQGLKASLQKLKTTHIDTKADAGSLGTAATKNVPTSGNASNTQVVMGNDSRLSDSRKASDVFAWAKADSKPTYTASEVGAIPTNEKGVANGVASLDNSGKVPQSQLPSYVDDVLEYDTKSAFPATGESGKIYVNKADNTSWRWSGSTYVQIKGDLAIGTTSGTAADGKVVNDHINNTSNPHGVTKEQVGLGNVGNFKAVSTSASQGLSDTEKANARANIGAGTSSFSGSYNDLSDKPTIPAAVTESTVSGWGFTKNAGTVTGIKMNGSSKGTSGVVDLGTVITAHQDISGKVDKTTTVNGHALSGNVSVTKSDVGLGNVGNFKAVSTVASQGLTDTEKSNARANIGAGTSSFSGSYNDLSNKPTIPTVNNGKLSLQANGTTKNEFTANQSGDTTFNIATGSSNGTISVGGADVSVKGLGSMAYKSSLSESDIPSIPKSKISDFPSSMPASDVYSWAKASSKPTYIANEVMSISTVAISANTSSSCSITGSGNAGKAQTIIYTNSGSSDLTVTVPTDYTTPDGAAIELTCKAGGYCEVSYLNIGGTIYARGL